MDRNKLSNFGLIFLIIGNALMLPYLTMPILKISSSKNILLLLILSLLYMVLLDAPLLYYANKRKNASLQRCADKNRNALVKIAGCVYLILIGYIIYVYANIIVQFIKIVITPGLSYWVIVSTIIATSVVLTVKGIKILLRVAVFFVPLLLFSILLFAIFSIPDLDATRLLPIYEKTTFIEINKIAILQATLTSEVVILVFFTSYVNHGISVKKLYFVSLMGIVVFLTITILPTIMILGNKYPTLLLNPYYTFARQIKFYDSLERFHALSVLAGFPCMIMRLSTKCLTVNEIIKEVFKIVKTRGFVLGFIGMIVCGLLVTVSINSQIKDKLLNLEMYAIVILVSNVVLTIFCWLSNHTKKQL
ncbi:MAG: spore germination protein [Christensenellaceae bacterium]|jgi:spore germination protein KB|nr:spore germination protein [Christensenellaceae bacterium]